jgi:hypothetical protein
MYAVFESQPNLSWIPGPVVPLVSRRERSGHKKARGLEIPRRCHETHQNEETEGEP